MTPCRRAILSASLAAFAGVLGACESSPQRAAVGEPAHALDAPTYAEVAQRYNARTGRLQKVWARAVVSIRWRDQEGRRRYEQGDGHFQFIAPSRFALSVGKFGDVFLWVGCDDDRYWLLEPKGDSKLGVAGRHGAVNEEKLDALGLPAAPLDLVRIAAVAPLPASPPPGASVAWSSDGAMLVVDLPSARGLWRYWLDPATTLPRIIELLDSRGEAVISAAMEQYGTVRLQGVGGFFPEMPTRVRATHHPSGSTLLLTLESMNDGGTGRLLPEAFQLDALARLLGVSSIRDLDAPFADAGDSAP